MESLFDHEAPKFALLTVTICSTIIFISWSLRAVYYLKFHSLSKFPGYTSWAASRVPFVLAMIRGRYVHKVRDMHRRYGPIVRIAPDELSFALPSAWPVIHQRRGARNPFLKNPIFIIKPDTHPVDSIPTTTNIGDHERMKKVLDKSFTKGSVRLQEPIVQSSMNLMMKQLGDQVAKAGVDGASINMTDWFGHVAFDVIGDLAFGEPFGCLQNGKSHKWVAICTDYVKALTFATAMKYYPWVEFVLKRIVPTILLKSHMEKEEYHYNHTVRMVTKRLNLEKKRNDIMTAVIDHMGQKNHLTLEEVFCNLGFLIVAGSETTALTLSGITNYLVQTPEVQSKLEKEIRERFMSDTEIVLEAVEELPYLNGVVQEGLRMCNPIPAGNSRIVPSGGAIICGEFIPPGTFVSVHPFTLHFSAEYFSEPDRFYPERWIEPRPGSIINHEPSAMNPFSMGAKKCLGFELAYSELRLMIAKLVFNFDVRPDPQYNLNWQDLKIYFSVERNPVMVRLHAR